MVEFRKNGDSLGTRLDVYDENGWIGWITVNKRKSVLDPVTITFEPFMRPDGNKIILDKDLGRTTINFGR